MTLDKSRFTDLIKNFKFKELFNELGWEHFNTEQIIAVEDQKFKLTAVSEKRGFVVFVCSPDSEDKIPPYNIRKQIDSKITKLHFEHLIIYTDKSNSHQIWQLVIREPDKPVVVRETPYFSTQQPELLFQRLRGILFNLEDEEKITLADVRSTVREQFNTNAEKVTKKFYQEFKNQHTAFLKFIDGIESVVDKEWYASLMLNRLMFIYFIQKKGFLDNNINYLNDKLKETKKKKGENKFYSFYRNFLLVLFHKGLGSPERDEKLLKEIGKVPYLNGGLFDVHKIEKDYKKIEIEDKAFEKIFNFFDEYNWHLDTRITATGRDINPDVIGYIFEKYINDRAAMGAYYTKEDITEYISKNTIIPFLFDEVKKGCAEAFKDDSSLWKMLRENPDRYIYDAVKHGIYESVIASPDEIGTKQSQLTVRELPKEISIGLDTTKPNLLERRKNWNKPAPEEFALPTEIWREVVERRNRYFEVKSKIESGEIKEINDFITYNLNIRQFAQDAVEQYEGSDFINALYKAIRKITILDPTCGSGAFLFAALNILEPLYGACLQRMRGFVEDDDKSKGKKFSQFRNVLEEIENHPNEKYYIYKSIILNNLYGVDIMNEAVEIAKLRLFLKLVAEVEDFNHLEPLPDIDFNIRTGNTLIGFATKEELDKGLTWSLNIGTDTKKVYDELDIVAKAFKSYKVIQLEDETDHRDFKKAKDDLNARLKNLNDTLNDYLGNEYGKTRKKKQEFEKWLNNYKPFHWFAEFYEIVNDRNGFDVIIGNPPYVEYSKVKKDYLIKSYYTLSCSNLYPFVIERILNLIHKNTNWSMILPLSAFCTQRMKPLVSMLKERNSNKWFSHFGWRPATLFEGVNIPLSIIVCSKIETTKKFFTSEYFKWYQENRSNLFSIINYMNSTDLLYQDFVIPKVGYKMDKIISKMLIKKIKIVNSISTSSTPNVLYYRNTGGLYWRIITNFKPYFSLNGLETNSSTLSTIFFPNKDYLDISTSVLNSNLFWLFYVAYSSFHHLNSYDITDFPFDPKKLSSEMKENLLSICTILMKDLNKNSEIMKRVHKGGNDSDVQTFFPSKSKVIVDKIDQILSHYYNFSADETDFIINYDYKFRINLNSLEEE